MRASTCGSGTPWDAFDGMAAPERATTAGVGAPRPPTSVPDARRSVPARFGARASAAGAWDWAPHRRAPQAPLACSGACGEIGSSRDAQRAKQTDFLMAHAVHEVAVAAGALRRPLGPSRRRAWRRRRRRVPRKGQMYPEKAT